MCTFFRLTRTVLRNDSDWKYRDDGKSTVCAKDRPLVTPARGRISIRVVRPGKIWHWARAGMDSHFRQDRTRRLVSILNWRHGDCGWAAAGDPTRNEGWGWAARYMHGRCDRLSPIRAGRSVVQHPQCGPNRRDSCGRP